MNVPADITARRAKIMADQAIGKHVPQVDIDRLTAANRTVGNEHHYRGAPCFPPGGRMPFGCTMTGTRPGDSSKYIEDVATSFRIER